MVNLSSLNYADVIPQVYAHFDANLLSRFPHSDRFEAVNRVREGLTKSLGIAGAARTGNGLRILSDCTPDDLRLKNSPRSLETEETAIKRGNEFFGRVYDRNPLFDVRDTERASPDYLFVVKGINSITCYGGCKDNVLELITVPDIVYGRLFSFDEIIDDMTSSYAMVSALYGMNSPGQMRNHMLGMLLNGASREELIELQKLLHGLAEILGVTFRFGPVEVPTLPVENN